VKVYYKPSINNKILDVIAEADRLGKTIEKITLPSVDHKRLQCELFAMGRRIDQYFTIPITVEE
jgi:hypothetical protein